MVVHDVHLPSVMEARVENDTDIQDRARIYSHPHIVPPDCAHKYTTQNTAVCERQNHSTESCVGQSALCTMGCSACRPRKPPSQELESHTIAAHAGDHNPWNQFNTQLLVTSEDYRQREKRMRDAARHFYVDSDNYELFVDVTVPVYESSSSFDDPSTQETPPVAQILCAPLNVLDLDEPLQSVLARLRQETESLLPADQWRQSHLRSIVLCGDRHNEVIRTNTMDDEVHHLWHTYMRMNAENLAQRPRALYGGLPGSDDCAPINTCPIAIQWQLV